MLSVKPVLPLYSLKNSFRCVYEAGSAVECDSHILYEPHVPWKTTGKVTSHLCGGVEGGTVAKLVKSRATLNKDTFKSFCELLLVGKKPKKQMTLNTDSDLLALLREDTIFLVELNQCSPRIQRKLLLQPTYPDYLQPFINTPGSLTQTEQLNKCTVKEQCVVVLSVI